MIPYLLVILGLALILVEFYIPGGLIGILGGISILTAIIMFASEAHSVIGLLLFIAGTAVAVALIIRYAIWYIVHTKGKFRIYSNDDQEGYVASEFDKNAIGKTGVVLSDLKPGGFILVDGRKQQAISLSGYIPKGEHVSIVGGQEQSLMVKLKKEQIT